MKLEDMHFEGRLKEIDKIRKDLESLPEGFINKAASIVCAQGLKKVFISPIEAGDKLKIIPCKELEHLEIYLSENKVKFSYNERKYYIYGAPKMLTSADMDLSE